MSEKSRYLVRTIYTTYIDKVVEADNAEEAEQLAFCITGDTSQYESHLDNAQTEVEEVSDSEELTEITAHDQQWIDALRNRRSEREQGGTSDVATI